VGAGGCLALGRAVVRCPTLRRLDLAHAGFGDTGAAALALGIAGEFSGGGGGSGSGGRGLHSSTFRISASRFRGIRWVVSE